MAGSVRDLVMAVRVVDRASGQLRRIGAEMRRMDSGARGAAAQRKQIADKTAANAAQRVTLANEIRSLQTGKLKQASESRIAAAKADIAKSQNDEFATGQKINRLTAQRLGYINQIQAATAGAKAARGSETGQFQGKTPEQWNRQLQRVIISSQNVRQEQLRLTGEAEAAAGRTAAARVRADQLVASEEIDLANAIKLRSNAVDISTVSDRALAAEDAKLAAVEARFNSQANIAKWAQRGQQIEQVGHSLTIMGAAGVLAFGLMGKAAADFGTQATVAATQSTVGGRQTVAQVLANAKFIQAQILKLTSSGRVIEGPKEQASAVYQIFSGVTLKGNQLSQLRQGIALLKDFNRVVTANAGLVSLEEVTRAGIILMNRFGLTVAQVPKALNTMQAAVRYGALNMSQFISTLSQAGPAADAAGASFTQSASAIAFISRQFPAIRLGTTGYARLLETLARPKIVQGLRQHGVEITQVVNGTRKLAPITEIAQRILTRFHGEIGKGSLFLQNFFKIMGNTEGFVNARRVLIAYLQHLGQARTILRQVTADKHELDRSFAAAAQSPGVRFKEFQVQLKTLAITVGMDVIPILAKLGAYLQRGIAWFQALNPHTRRAIVEFALWGSIITLVAGVILTITGAMMGLVNTIRFMIGARGLAAASAETGALQVRMGLLLGVIGVLIFAFIRFHSQTMAVINALGGLKQVLILLGAAFFTVTVLGWVRSLITFLGTTALAETAALELGATLAALPAVIPILIVLTILERDKIKKAIEKVGNYVASKIPGVHVGKVTHSGTGAPDKGYFGLWGLDPVPGHPYYGRDPKTGELYKWNPGKAMFEPAGTLTPGAAAGPGLRGAGPGGHPIARQVQRISPAVRAAANQYGAVLTPNITKLAQAYVRAAKAAHAAELAEQKHPSAAHWQAVVKAEEAFSAAQDALSSAATQQQMDAYKKATKALLKGQDDTTKNLKDNLDKQKTNYQDTIDSVMQMYQNFFQQEQSNFGQLFGGPMQGILQFRQQQGLPPTGALLLKDIRGQVRTYEHFNNSLNALARRGAPAELIKQLRQLGPQALPEILALKRMPANQWRAYIQSFQKAQADIRKQTIADLRSQLALYRRFGQNVGQAIQQGLADEAPGLRKELRSIIESMFPQLKGGPRTSAKTSASTGGTKNTYNTTYNHPTTVQGTGESTEAALARHRTRIRNRPNYGPRTTV